MTVPKTTVKLWAALALATTGAVQLAHAIPHPAASSTVVSTAAVQSGDQMVRFQRGNVVIGRTVQPATPASGRSAAADTHTIKFDVLDRTGRPPANAADKAVFLIALNGAGSLFARLTDGHAKGSFPAGDYAIFTEVNTPEAGGSTSSTLVYLSKVSITGDTSLLLDARKARPVQVAVDRKDARAVSASVIVTQKIAGTVQPTALLLADYGTDLYTTPTGADSDLVYRVQERLTRNGAQTGSPYVYNVAAAVNAIPAHPLRVRDKDLAAVRTRYAGEGGAGCAGGHAGVDWGVGVTILNWAGIGALPTTRTEYYTPGLTWGNDRGVTSADCSFTRGNVDSEGRQDRFAPGTLHPPVE